MQRRLGRSGLLVSALGMGTNALGGPIWNPSVRSDGPAGYGEVDESTALETIRAAFDAGVTFFDTADEYGCGRAERLLGTALRGRRSEVVLATKFGHTFDEATCTVTGSDASPDALRRACEASLRRLGTDVIDLYLLHLRDLAIPAAAEVRDTLECLVSEGKIRFYGWSTDDVARARFFAEGEHCAAVEHRLNIFLDAVEMLEICDEYDLASVNRIPLLMGILTGRHRGRRPVVPDEDVRSRWFAAGGALRDVRRVEELRDVLTEDGRTVAQGALGWIWARHPRAVPIPGSRTPLQAIENAAAMRFGPLGESQMTRIAAILETATG